MSKVINKIKPFNGKFFRCRHLLLSIAAVFSASNLFAQNVSPLDVSQFVSEYRASRESLILNDFVELLSLPNVAQNQDDIDINADYIMALLEQREFSTQRLQSGGSPYIYAEMMQAGATETILLYAHYDGQPVQVENWEYPPFTPTLLDSSIQSGGQPIEIDDVTGSFDPEWRLYARSAGDDKMPIIALLHTLDALVENNIDLSINLKLLLDGEEEAGSPSLARVMDENPGLLDADLLLFSDGPMHQSRNAQLVFGVRGSKTLDLTTYGANRPLHSGHYGNWAPNPIMHMAYLLTSMRNESGRILIEGYYDDVVPVNDLERSAIAAMPDITENLKNELAINIPEGDGVRLEELVTLPAINVRGFSAGGVSTLGRNIILSNATASLNIRLVANQQPEGVEKLIEAHISQQGFHIVYEDPTDEILRDNEKVIKLDWRGRGSPGFRTPLDDSMSQRLVQLMQSLTTELIITPSMGGSLPLDSFAARMDTPIIILPLANHDNNQHAENENIRLQNIWDAMSIYGVILANFGI